MSELSASLARAWRTPPTPVRPWPQAQVIAALGQLLDDAQLELDTPVYPVTVFCRVVAAWAAAPAALSPVEAAWSMVGAELWQREAAPDQRALYLLQAAWQLGRACKALGDAQPDSASRALDETAARLVALGSYDGALDHDPAAWSPIGRGVVHTPSLTREAQEAARRRDEVDLTLALRFEELVAAG